MIYLPDVNFWIALNLNRHIHNEIATRWLGSAGQDELVFCLVTEMGLLRLLTNAHIMGADVRTPVRAWKLYERVRTDSRISFRDEPVGFTALWRLAAPDLSNSANAWTDAYLAVFAHQVNATVVTLDRNFKAIQSCRILTLGGGTS